MNNFKGIWRDPYAKPFTDSSGYLTDHSKELMRDLKVTNLEYLLDKIPGYWSKGQTVGTAKVSGPYVEPGSEADETL